MNYANYGFFSITSKATTLITRFGQNSIITSGSYNAIFGAGDTVSGQSNLVFGYNNSVSGNNSIYIGNNISTGSNSLIINSLRSSIQNTNNNYFNIMDIITSSNHSNSLTITRTTSFPQGIKIGNNDISLCQGTTNTVYISGNLEVSGTVSGIFDITSTNCNIGGTLSVSGIISAYSNLSISYSNNTEPMLILSNTNTILSTNQSIIKYANTDIQMYGILDSVRSTFGYGPSVYPSHYLFSIKKNGEIQMYKSSTDITNSNSNSTSVFKLDTNGDINISNNLIVGNNLYISQNLLITGLTTFNNTATFEGNVITNDIVTINSNLNITGSMRVANTAIFNSNIIATSTDTFSAFKNIYITGDLQVCGTNTINNTQTLTGENNYLVINTGNSSTSASGFFIKRYQELNNTNTGYITQNDSPIISTTLPSATSVTNSVQLFSTNPGYDVTNWIIRFTSNTTEYVRRIETYNSGTFIAVLSSDVPGVNSNFIINLYDKPSVGLFYDETSKYFKFVGGLLDSNEALSDVTSNTLFNLSLGELELVSNIYVSGTSEIEGNANFKDDVLISNNLSVSGNATFSNITTSNGILNMKNISGNTIYYITTAGNTSISGTLTIANTANLQAVNVSNTLNVLSNMVVASNAIFSNIVSFKNIVTFSNFNNIFFTGNSSSYPLSISNSLSTTNSPVYIEMSNASPNSILIGMGSSNNAAAKMFEVAHKVSGNYKSIFYITNDYNLYFKKADGTTLMNINSNGDLSIAGEFGINNLTLDTLTLNSNLILFKTLDSNEFLTIKQGTENYPSYITFSNSNQNYQTKFEIGTYNSSYPFYLSASNYGKNVFSKSKNIYDILLSLNNLNELYINTNIKVSGSTTLGNVASDTVLIYGNTTFSNNLTVLGTTTLGNVASDTITLTGTTSNLARIYRVGGDTYPVYDYDTSSTSVATVRRLMSYYHSNTPVGTNRVGYFGPYDNDMRFVSENGANILISNGSGGTIKLSGSPIIINSGSTSESSHVIHFATDASTTTYCNCITAKTEGGISGLGIVGYNGVFIYDENSSGDPEDSTNILAKFYFSTTNKVDFVGTTTVYTPSGGSFRVNNSFGNDILKADNNSGLVSTTHSVYITSNLSVSGTTRISGPEVYIYTSNSRTMLISNSRTDRNNYLTFSNTSNITSYRFDIGLVDSIPTIKSNTNTSQLDISFATVNISGDIELPLDTATESHRITFKGVGNEDSYIRLGASDNLEIYSYDVVNMFTGPSYGVQFSLSTVGQLSIGNGLSTNQFSPFTGSHLIYSQTLYNEEDYGKLIAIDKYIEYISVNDARFTFKLSDTKKNKKAYGILSTINNVLALKPHETEYIDEDGYLRKYNEKYYQYLVNGLGEGAIYIINTNGNIENGDYLQSSDIPGFAEKQDDDLIHNYTVAKVSIDTTFTEGEHELISIKYVDSNGNWVDANNYNSNIHYKVALIPCIYLCS